MINLTMVNLIAILIVFLVGLDSIQAGHSKITTKIRKKADDGGPDIIYEMVGDILVSKYREGVNITYFHNIVQYSTVAMHIFLT